MSLSYLSKPIKPEPYVAPFDLSLMAKVLGEEQGKFDAEGQKVQSQIDELGNLDVIKGVDKEYLNGKVNNLVKNLNDLGGVNLADENVASQIEGMPADIYGDDKVINAIASTRQIRNLQASYQKFKTDPKLSKQYSAVNEAWDNQFVNHYLSDGQVGSSYSGPSSATPYSPYRDNLIKIAKDKRANLTTNITADGTSYITTEGKVVTPESIMQSSADLLLPEEKLQMEKDGWYAFKDAPPEAVVNQSLQYNDQKVTDAKMALSKYKAQAAAAGADPAMKSKYTQMVEEQNKYVNQLEETSKKISTEGLKRYAENPHGFMGQVYKDQFYRGLGERFAYSEQRAKIASNPMAVAQMRMRQQDDQFNQRMLATAIEKGLGYVLDPTTGKVTLTGEKTDPKKTKNGKIDVEYASSPAPDPNNPESYKKTEDNVKQKITEFEAIKTAGFDSFWKNYLNQNDDVAEILQSGNPADGTGQSIRLIGQKMFENVNGKPGFQIDDLNFNLDPSDPGVKKWERLVHEKNPQLSEAQIYNKLWTIKQMYNDYNKLTNIDHNPNIDVSKIDPGLINAVNQHQLITEQQDALKYKVDKINGSLYTLAGLKPEEIQAWEDYNKDPNAHNVATALAFKGSSFYYPQSANLYRNTPPDISAIKAKLDKVGFDKAKADYWANISNRPTFMHKIFEKDDPAIKEGYLPNLVSHYLQTNGSDDQSIKPGTFSTKDIEVREIGKNAAGTGYAVNAIVNTGTEKEPVLKNVSTTITAAEAAKLGFMDDPMQGLNESVMIKGRSNPLLIAAAKQDGTTLAAKIRLVQSNFGDRSDQRAFPQLVVEDANGKTRNINLPRMAGDTPSIVYQNMQELINTYAAQGWTLPQIIYTLEHPEKK